LTTEFGRIDATVSSRLASASYTAPDNAAITAIKTKTDNLPSDPMGSQRPDGKFLQRLSIGISVPKRTL